jgi:hypothetical protein
VSDRFLKPLGESKFAIVALLLALLLTQAASSVCTAQCMEHGLPVSSNSAVMSHCHSMVPPVPHAAVANSYPATCDSICAVEPQANVQSTAPVAPSTVSESRVGLLPALLIFPLLFSSPRSSAGVPPLITPLRV